MNSLPHDRIKPFEGAGSKKEQVGDMFNDIAPRYDMMNRFLSAGIDIGWRKKAISKFIPDSPRSILDIATGTGDMAIMAAKMLPGTLITGIDISTGMLELGKKKVLKAGLDKQISLHDGDSETILFPANTFEGGMVAFGVRNFENLHKGMSEILRVLKPGAQIVVLEFSKPSIPGVKGLYNFYMNRLAPFIARLFGQNPKAYKYLTLSSQAFPDRESFEAILKETGFIQTSWKPLTLGICCIYTGRKPG